MVNGNGTNGNHESNGNEEESSKIGMAWKRMNSDPAGDKGFGGVFRHTKELIEAKSSKVNNLFVEKNDVSTQTDMDMATLEALIQRVQTLEKGMKELMSDEF